MLAFLSPAGVLYWEKCSKFVGQMADMRKLLHSILWTMAVGLLAACSATKFVPDGEYMLEDVSVKSVDKSFSASTLNGYIRQHPNSKWFSLLKVPMGPYALSGLDTTKRINRFLQRVGEAPVIFDTVQANRSGESMLEAVRNMGYLQAQVNQRRTVKGKKVKETNMYKLGKFTFDTQRQILAIGDKQTKLTTKESELLSLLCAHANDVLQRELALKTIWIDDNYFNARSMDVYITKLRKHLKDDPSIEINNVHGKGYRLIIPTDED